MRRRRFLGAICGALSIAGCLASDTTPGDGASETPTTEPVPTPTDTRRSSSTDTSTGQTPTPTAVTVAGEPFETFALSEQVGDVGPLGVAIENIGAQSRTVDLSITEVLAGLFDTCNDYGVDATITPPGRIDASIYTTEIACETPTATGT